jgi:uncharacterized YccA/Bax inhibitor family protein
MMRTANPALNERVFQDAARSVPTGISKMTISGTVNRTGLLILLTIAVASYAWQQTLMSLEGTNVFGVGPLLWIGAIGGLIIALVTVFKKTWAPITAPLYAGFEGLFLGAISASFEMMYPGIVFQAVLGTFGTLFALLAAYRSGLIKATENFKLGVAAATGGIFLIYMLTMILGFFGVNIPFIHDSGPIGILFSVGVVTIAALNLVLDFDFIENGEKAGAPKYMEWYAAFGLLVTLIWLYLEILRLLAKLNSRR